MNESADLLRLRVLLCFLRSTPENCNVTGISRTLREEKYTISRMMAHLERDGLVDQSLAIRGRRYGECCTRCQLLGAVLFGQIDGNCARER